MSKATVLNYSVLSFRSVFALALFLLPFAAQAQFPSNANKIVQGIQTTAQGIVSYSDTVPLHTPTTSNWRHNTQIHRDTSMGVEYLWRYPRWYASSLVKQSNPPPATRAAGSNFLDYTETLWQNSTDSLTYYYEEKQQCWQPVGTVVRDTTPVSLAATGTSAAVCYEYSLWYNSTNDSLYAYTAGDWLAIGSGGGGTAGAVDSIVVLQDSIIVGYASGVEVTRDTIGNVGGISLPIAISDVTGLADSLANARAATIIPIPPAFNYFPPFDILRVSPDSFRVDPTFDLETYANISATDTFYVDVSVVSSGTGQSWAQAYKGLDEAITAANSSGTAKLIYVAKGWYGKANSWNGVVPTVQVKVIGDLTQGAGTDVFLTTDLRDVTGSFSPTSNYYSASLTTEPDGVYDASLADAFGDSQTLTKRSSIALVNSNPGSWHWAANVLYIRTSDSRAPDVSMRYYDDATNAVINADSSTFYLKNLEFRGKGLIASNASSDGECTVLVEDCGSKETIEYAVSANGITLLLFGGTWAKSDSTDLLNYHSANTVIPSVIEYNLTVYNSAELHTGCGNCQASTGHDGAEIIRINGDYSYSSGQTIADVSGTNTWCLGTNVHDSRTGIGFYFGSAGTAGNYFLLDCASESTVDIRSEADATIRYRNFTPDPPVVDGAGSFYAHYTYNSDGLATLPGGLISGLTDNYIPRALGTDDLENSQIFDNGTDIGIFTNAPEADVHIKRNDVTGTVTSSAAHLAIEDSAQDPTFTFYTTRTRASNFGFRDEYQPLGGIAYYSTNHSTLPNRMSFFTRNSGTTTAKATIDSIGRMGIGIQSPEKLLHLYVNNVVQTAQSDVNILIEKGSDDVAFQFLTGVSRRGTFFWGDATNTALGFIRYDMSSGSVANNMFFGTAGSNRWQINASGAWLASTDNSWDIGASGATRPRTGYFGTSVVSPIFNATTGVQINGAATSNTILKGNGTNYVSSTETYAAPGASGNVMTSDGTNWTSAAPAAAVVNLSLSGSANNVKIDNSAGTDVVLKGGSNISILEVVGTLDTAYISTVEHWGEVSIAGGSTSVTAGTPERPDNDTPGTQTTSLSSEYTNTGSQLNYIGAAGQVEVKGAVSFSPSATGDYLISIFQEGVELAVTEVRATCTASEYTTVSVLSASVSVAPNDTFDVRIEPVSGSATITVHRYNIYSRKIY